MYSIFDSDSYNLKIDAYEPCPCGSGKKFKYCCYQKARDEKHSENKKPKYSSNRINHIAHKSWETANLKVCLAFDSTKCDGNIKGAHSIQNNRILNRISEEGHLLRIASEISDDEPKTIFKKISKNKASTFFGFCDFHDTELFKPIEIKEYKRHSIQDFLFAYRAHAIEYHRKMQSLNEAQKHLKENPSEMLKYDSFLIYRYRVTQLDIKDFENDYYIFKQDYLNENYNNLITIYRHLDYEIKFATTSSFAVQEDLYGNKINQIYDLRADKMSSIYLNIYPVEGGTNILISYHLDDSDQYKGFFEQLQKLSNEELTNYLNYLIIQYTENVFFILTLSTL